MGIPIISDILNVGRTAVESFFTVVPSPLKVILFLLILVLFGNLIMGFFLNDKYECEFQDVQNQQKLVLVNTEIYNQCLGHFGTAWSAKHNLSTVILENPQNVSIQDLQARNESIQSILAWNYFNFVTFNVPNQVVNSFNFWRNYGIWSENKTFEGFFDAINDPNKYSCGRLSNCLPTDISSELGLSSQCSVDQTPEWSEYEDATRIPKGKGLIVDPQNSGVRIFSVQCSQFFDPPQPQFTMFGFEFLNVKVWMIIFIIGGFISAAIKLDEFGRKN